jgi:hypothetical protein
MPSTRPLNPGRPSKGFLPSYWSHSLNFKDEIAKYSQNLQKSLMFCWAFQSNKCHQARFQQAAASTGWPWQGRRRRKIRLSTSGYKEPCSLTVHVQEWFFHSLLAPLAA